MRDELLKILLDSKSVYRNAAKFHITKKNIIVKKTRPLFTARIQGFRSLGAEKLNKSITLVGSVVLIFIL